MKKTLILVLVILTATTAFLLWNGQNRPQAPSHGMADSGQGAPAIGGGFTLTDMHGKTVRDTDYRGRVMLVFFGYTNCPDVCPVTGAILGKTLALLGGKASEVAPLFITVDPRRDTPAVMKDYLANFDARIVGLTGTDDQIRQAVSAYKAYFAPTPMEESGHGHDVHGQEQSTESLLVDHSAFIYMMDRNGAYLRHFPYNVPEQELADAVKQAL